MKKPKVKKARDWHAVNAHFRRSGVMGHHHPKKGESAKECRRFKHSRSWEDDYEDLEEDGYDDSATSTQSK